jgi:AraC-like DNA-binding protein
MSILVRETKLIHRSTARCPLGQVSVAAYIRDSPGVPRTPLRVFGSYAIVLILHGGGRYIDATGLDRPVSAGDCILVLPDLPHAYFRQRTEPRWDELYVTFSGPAFDLWRRAGLLRPGNLVHRLEPLDYWHARLERCANPDPLQAVALVQRFLSEALSTHAPAEQDDQAWLKRATRLIGVGPKPEWADVARQLGCGYETFRRRLTALTGQPPAKFHAHRVIEHACELLKDRSRSLRDIAIDCGFCDEFHFSRRFKQLMGVRPAALRERLG